MNIDLDEALGRLAAAPHHPGLTEIEVRVFAGIRERDALATQALQGLRVGAIAALAALGLGIAAGSPVEASPAPDTLAPFGPLSPLAPSTLLAPDR